MRIRPALTRRKRVVPQMRTNMNTSGTSCAPPPPMNVCKPRERRAQSADCSRRAYHQLFVDLIDHLAHILARQQSLKPGERVWALLCVCGGAQSRTWHTYSVNSSMQAPERQRVQQECLRSGKEVNITREEGGWRQAHGGGERTAM